MNKKVIQFHQSRIAFMLIDENIIYLENSKMGHDEWFLSLGYPIEEFDLITRGYYKDGKIIFYRGDFVFDDKVISDAKMYSKQIMTYVNDFEAEVYVGVKRGKIGTPWMPILKIENDMLEDVLNKSKRK